MPTKNNNNIERYNKPAGTIPIGILIAASQSSLSSSPFTT
jgi:hypothetical protein